MRNCTPGMKRMWRSLPPLARGWILSFLCWGIVAFSLGIQMMIHRPPLLPWQAANLPQTGSWDWWIAVAGAIRDWLPWAVITPLIFRLVQRQPIDLQHWKIALPVHVAAGIAAVLLFEGWRQFMRPEMRLQPPPPFPVAQEPGPMGGRPAFMGPPGGAFEILHLATFDMPIYLMLVSAAHTLIFYRRTREREASLAIARSEAQKMQLQPHFLFNTLNMIAELVHSEPDKADAMLTALSGLLRMTLDTAGEQELPLQQEMNFVDRYLSIMHARFDDRLQFRLDMEPATRAALVPTFILQPLVENAIEHGLGPRTKGGHLTITSRREEDKLHLCVADDGVGLTGGAAGLEGIGLRNTRNRLRELYGEAGRMELHENGGVAVHIHLPFHLE